MDDGVGVVITFSLAMSGQVEQGFVVCCWGLLFLWTFFIFLVLDGEFKGFIKERDELFRGVDVQADLAKSFEFADCSESGMGVVKELAYAEVVLFFILVRSVSFHGEEGLSYLLLNFLDRGKGETRTD
jgi:hypothetical protein